MEREKKIKFLGIFLIVAMALFSLLPIISKHYIFDDIVHVRGSDLDSYEKIPSLFSQGLASSDSRQDPLYRPATLLSLYLDRLIFGHSAFAYHCMNLLLHILASILLFVLLSKFLGYGPRSVFASLIFAVHPVHVDTVAFIINRSDIIALIFLLSSVLFLLKDGLWKNYISFKAFDPSKTSGPGLGFFLALPCLFLAMLSKETAVSSVIVLFTVLMIRICLDKKLPPRAVILGSSIIVIVSAAYFLTRFLAVKTVGAPSEIGPFRGAGFTVIFPTMSRVFLDYILLLIAPCNLKVNYVGYHISRNLFELKAVISYVIHAFALTSAFLLVKRRLAVSFCIFAFYATLLPVSHIFPFNDIMAERFLYIPSVFFCLLVSYPLGSIKPDRKYYRIAVLLFVVLTLTYASLSLRYSTFFASPKLLWGEMLNRSPNSALFNSNMGLYLFYHEKDYNGAVSYLEKAHSLNPRYGNYLPLAMAYDLIGDDKKAKESFLKGIEIKPLDLDLNLNYAVFNCLNGDFRQAYPYLKKVLKIDPKNADALAYLKEVERRLKVKKR